MSSCVRCLCLGAADDLSIDQAQIGLESVWPSDADSSEVRFRPENTGCPSVGGSGTSGYRTRIQRRSYRARGLCPGRKFLLHKVAAIIGEPDLRAWRRLNNEAVVAACSDVAHGADLVPRNSDPRWRRIRDGVELDRRIVLEARCKRRSVPPASDDDARPWRLSGTTRRPSAHCQYLRIKLSSVPVCRGFKPANSCPDPAYAIYMRPVMAMDAGGAFWTMF
jgi:hypothetical protein